MKKSFCISISTIIFLIVFLFTSCMGAESKIKIKNDGSGNILFSYRISQMLLNMGDSMNESEEEPWESSPDDPIEDTESESEKEFIDEPEDEGTADLPLPITKEDFEKNIAGIEGLKLIDVTQTETEQDLIITAELEFDNVETLAQSEAFREWPVSFEKVEDSYVFSQVLSEGTVDNPEAAMDEETINMMESMFPGYKFIFSVEAPSPIKDYNIGELSTDKKTVTYTISIADMMRIKEKLEFVVIW